MAASQKRKAKRAKPVAFASAMSRLYLMLQALEEETRKAIWAKATLEVGNDIVMAKYKGVTFDGADCYNSLYNSAQTALILSLCKIFENPNGRRGQSKAYAFNHSDLAAIPIFLHFINQKRCRFKLIENASACWNESFPHRSKMWEADCLAALQRIDEKKRSLSSPKGRRATKTLISFRNDHFAHLYFEPRPWNSNRYNELFFLLDIATDIVSYACIVLHGRNLDFKEREELCRDEACAFWQPALAAAIANDPHAIEGMDIR